MFVLKARNRALVFITLLALIFWCLAASQNGMIRKLSGSVSVRWDTGGASPAALLKYESYAREDGAVKQPEATLWQQGARQTVSDGEYRELDSSIITVFGKCEEVTSAQMLHGSFPAWSDTEGCAVSSGLAFALWGGVDVLGMPIYIGNEVLYIRGVYDASGNNTLLRQARSDSDTALANMQLRFPEGGNREEAENWLKSTGLGGGTVLDLPFLGWACGAMLEIPVILLVGYIFIRLISRARGLRHYPLLLLRYIPLALVIAAGTVLCMNSLSIPARLIPTMWSNFDFWKSLFSGFFGNIKVWLAAESSMRDMELWPKVLILIFLTPLSAALMIISAKIVRIHSYKYLLVYCSAYMAALCAVSMIVSAAGDVAFNKAMYLVPCIWISAECLLSMHETHITEPELERIENDEKKELASGSRISSSENKTDAGGHIAEKPGEYARK